MLNLLLEIGVTDKSFWDISFKIGDVILLLLLGFGAYQGYLKGIVVELISLFLLVFVVYWVMTGTYLGFEFINTSDTLSEFSRRTTPFLTFFIFIIVLALAMEFVANLLRKILRFTLFGAADSILGGAFSFIKYCFSLGLLAVLCIDIGAVSLDTIEKKSVLMPWVMGVFEYIVLLLDSIGVDIKLLLQKIEELLRR